VNFEMERKALRGGRLLEGAYDEAEQVLELVFSDLTVRRFKSVPVEVWKRLLAAPNAGTFYEDRIQEEYPWISAPKLSTRSKAPLADDPAGVVRAKLNDLFGKPD
jgi:hypothetical protein